jgi:hypothetical protein
MKTSLTELDTIERYIFNRLPTGEKIVFEARLLTDSVFRFNVNCQNKVYAMVRFYHRRKLKDQAEQCYKQLFSNPSKKDFQQEIFKLFNI